MPWLGCRGWHVVFLEMGWRCMLYFLLWPYLSNLDPVMKLWKQQGHPSLTLTQTLKICKSLLYNQSTQNHPKGGWDRPLPKHDPGWMDDSNCNMFDKMFSVYLYAVFEVFQFTRQQFSPQNLSLSWRQHRQNVLFWSPVWQRRLVGRLIKTCKQVVILLWDN